MEQNIDRRMARLGIIVFLISIIIGTLFSCSKVEESSPIPKSHPAYGFYQIAKRGPTTLVVCQSYGGREIFPNDYETLEHIGQGIFTLREKATDKRYLGVSFGEGEIVVTIKTCCWEIER